MWIFAIVAAFVLISTRKAGADGSSGAGGPSQDFAENPSFPISGTFDTSPAPDITTQRQAQTKGFATGAGIAGAGATALAASFGWTAAAGPIGAAVAAAVILIDVLRSTAHLTANDFVKRFQNPFHADLAVILDAHDARMANGSETYTLALDTYDAIGFLWREFQVAAGEYAQHSGDAALVVSQGLHTLNGPNGLPGFPNGFINAVLGKLERELSQLSGNPLSMYA